jgi:hypothetical protein
MIELKKPSLKGIKDSEKIEELRRYLFTLIDDLQFAFQDLEKQIELAKTAQATATAAYTLATPDAVAYDGVTATEIATENIEGGEVNNEQEGLEV